MTIYYISEIGEVNTKEAWDAFFKELYAWIPYTPPIDYYTRMSRIVGLKPIELNEGIILTELKVYGHTYYI